MNVRVVAIDFGTTYSGYAFSVTKPGRKLKDVEILASQVWNSGTSGVASLKAPTSLLLRRHKEIVAFGFEAEEQYADITLDGKADHYYFFDRFKMELHNNKNITSRMRLEDVRGQTLPAIEVFELSIKALIDHLQQTVKIKNIKIDTAKITWVLTVPAIWTDRAKQFMRESAELAGIPHNMLKIALEPEAASIYCQTFPYPGSKDITKAGSKYVVADLGGGTVDITVHEKLNDGTLKELERARGTACGGTSIDKAFYQLMIRVFGAPLLHKMKSHYPSCHLALERCFEGVKRTLHPDKTGYVNVTIPYATLDSLCQSELGKNINGIAKSSSISKHFQLLGDKLRIDASFALSLFKSTSDSIVSLLESIVQKRILTDTAGIILVGGFAECKVIQENVQTAFPRQNIILQEDPGSVVLKGAVLFGYKSDYISSRIGRHTYGVRKTSHFDKNKYPEHRKTYINGEEKCKNVFDTFMEAKTSIALGHINEKTYVTCLPFQKRLTVEVYYTDNQNVIYTDGNDCTLLGKLSLDILNPTKHIRYITAIFHFGDTEFSVKVVDDESGSREKKFFELKD
ncbi:heat shock 70 kDa protein 12B-like [Mytilus trossulus]|uniref:heat shock 70 kDa protein 12B-like n=1 Tax=Mytilus trossulus TaxID=6551 RepID=UPI003004FEBE